MFEWIATSGWLWTIRFAIFTENPWSEPVPGVCQQKEKCDENDVFW